MKKFLLFIFLLFMAGSSWAVTVQVGTGTTTTTTLPISSCYGYSYTQQIYTQAQIATQGDITVIRFYYVSGTNTTSLNWVVYLGHTSKTSFTSTTDWVPLVSLTEVFSGIVTYPAGGNWMEITLTTPFTYNNIDNLVVAVDENTPGFSCSISWRSFTSASNTGIYYRNDATNPNPASPPTASGRTGTLAQIQFNMEQADCTGMPVPGNTISSANPACAGVNFVLSLQNPPAGSGVTYQWQSSPDGSDPWTNIGTSTPTHTTSQSADTYYRSQVSCFENTGTSNPVLVTMNLWYNCYCIPTYSSGGNTDGMVLVTLGPLSQATTGNISPYYYNYTSTQNTIPNLALGGTSNLSLTFASDPNQYSGAWIDFNQSGTFETTEFFTTNTNGGSNGVVIIPINVPPDATPGITRMRIRGGDDTQPTSNKPCGASNSTWGQAQDYMVNIVGPSHLQGYVYDFDGNPIAGATIEKVGEISTTSDAAGYYMLTPLSAGSYQFRAFKTGYNEVFATIDLPVNATVNHNFTLLQPQMDVAPESIFVILGPSETSVHELVITNNGNGMLDWQAGVISSLTCEYTIDLIDSYGDGWNGGKIDLLVNGVVVLNDLTIINGFGPESYSFEVSYGDEITTLWTAGSYPGENRYRINNSLGAEVWFAQGTSGPPNIISGQLNAACNVPWITLDNYSGDVDPNGGTQTVTVTIDASAAPGMTNTVDIEFTSPSGISPVTVPVTLVVTDGGLKGPEELTLFLVDVSEGKFMLKWKYFTLRDMVFDHFAIMRNGELFATSTVSKLDIVMTEPGTYCFKVYAVYENGAYSEPSNEVCITYPLAPGVPVSNWAILLGGLLIATFSFYMIRKRI